MPQRLVLFGALVACLLVASASGAVRAATHPQASLLGVPDGPVVSPAVWRSLARRDSVDVIVTLRDGELPSARRLAARREGVDELQDDVLSDLSGTGFELNRRWRATPGFAGTTTREGLEALRRSPDVEAVDVDRRMYAMLAESTALIRADQVQAQGVTGKGATVAVVDTGIDTDNPDLADDLVAQACFLHAENGAGACPGGGSRESGPGAAEDDEGHGTGVSAIITSRGTASPKGVAPDAKIVAVKVLDAQGSGPTSDIIAGLDWILASRPDVKVVNMSLGSPEPLSGPCDDFDAGTRGYASVINALRARGTIVFAASGNGATPTGMGDPACVGAAVSVGAVYDGNVGSRNFGDCSDATTAADKVICFTDADATLDLLAPGGVITAAKVGGGVEPLFGTSHATPHASAVAALMLESRPGLTPDQIEATLKATGVPVTDGRNGHTYRRIDALGAVGAVPALPDLPPPSFLAAGNSTFPDTAGETFIGPEMRGISAVSSGAGFLTFTVTTANRANLIAGEFFEIFLDVDQNPATGEGGADFLLIASANNPAVLARWAGEWQTVRLIESVGFAANVLTLTVVAHELHIRSDFSYWAVSGWSRGPLDRAPNAGSMPFPAFGLSVGKVGSGAGTITGPAIDCGAVCASAYRRDTSVTLTATPTGGSVFAEWTGACTGSGPCTTTLSEARQVTARFEAVRRITVTKSGTGVGTVTAAPVIDCGGTCVGTAVNGTLLNVTATPAPGSRLTAWGGSCTGTGPCQLAVDGDETVTATFADVAKPVVTVLRSSGRAGKLIRLRHRVRDNSTTTVRTEAFLQVRRRTVTTFFSIPSVATGRLVTALWVAPTVLPGPVRFCVRATDGAGNRSPLRCAPVRIRP